MLVIVLVVLFLLAIGGGAWGRTRFGGASWSPAIIIAIAALVLYFTGHLRIS